MQRFPPVLCLLLMFTIAAATGEDLNAVHTYLPPATAGVHHLCLIYHGQAQRVPWTAEALKPYVAYVDASGTCRDWLFDSFLFIEFATDAGESLHHYAPGAAQADGEDWAWLADCWFRKDTGLAGLERCVAEAGTALGDTNHKVNVVITLPVPLCEIRAFSGLPGTVQPLDFGRGEDRRIALEWYINTVRKKFGDAAYQHLNLLGFYWTGESISADQHETLRGTADLLHAQGLKFYWIPYFSAAGVEHWRDLGFDAMMLQPNYFFDGDGGIDRLMLAAKRARALGSGIEMEFDGRAFTSEAHLQRFWDYLDAGVRYGWMQEVLIGWYEGGNALLNMLKEGEKGRGMYDAVHQFVRGTYTAKTPERLPDIDPPPPPGKGQNLALASRGAVVHGAIDNGEPGLEPGQMIDGKSLFYTGTTGFTWFGVAPGCVTVELAQAKRVNQTRIFFYDLDGRHYTYRLETSLDGQKWDSAVDKSTGIWGGWQTDTFPEREARFLRLTCLSNSTGQTVCQVIEFEAYAP